MYPGRAGRLSGAAIPPSGVDPSPTLPPEEGRVGAAKCYGDSVFLAEDPGKGAADRGRPG